MTDHKTFGEMSKEEQLALFVAWQEGKKIEQLFKNWESLHPNHAIFWDDERYRIAFPKPFFDFSAFNKKWKWVAKDDDGEIYIFSEEPEKAIDCWHNKQGSNVYNRIEDLISPAITNLFDPSIPWQESLVERE